MASSIFQKAVLRLAGLSSLTMLLLLLSACGFRPLYSESSGVRAQTEQIRILPIADRSGQILHNALRDRLNPSGILVNPRYELLVTLSQTIGTIAGKLSDETSRKFLAAKATFQLHEKTSGKLVSEGSRQVRLHFAAFARTYDSLPAEQAARKNALSQLADQIAQALALELGRFDG